MKKLTQEEIEQIIRVHIEWCDSDGRYGKQADFSDTDLSGLDFSGLDLNKAIFKGAILNNTDFSGAELRDANFKNADLRQTYFNGADLYGASFENADLSGTVFCDANLKNTQLNIEDIRGANIIGAMFDKTYYQVACGGNSRILFCVEDDKVSYCCWNKTLAEFERFIEDFYGENGIFPSKKHYTQYMAVVEFFKKMVEVAKAMFA